MALGPKLASRSLIALAECPSSIRNSVSSTNSRHGSGRATLSPAAVWIAALPAAAASRAALVIGNSDYLQVGTLANPQSDTTAIVAALTAAGFDDVRRVENLGAEAMRTELKAFSARAAGSEIALVYYAGLGAEVAGQNDLIPVGAQLLRAADVEFEAIPLASVRAVVSSATKLRLVVLDACRSNLFRLESGNGTRGGTRGLRAIEAGAGELIAYAAKEGILAQDGPPGAMSPPPSIGEPKLSSAVQEWELVQHSTNLEVLTVAPA